MTNKPSVILHVGIVKLSVEFIRQYLTFQKFCSIYWENNQLRITFFTEDSEVAKRYRINLNESNPSVISCAPFLRSLNLPASAFKKYEDFKADIVKGNLTINIQL